MEAALKAIASPTRRAILELVRDTERSSGEIAARAGLSPPATSQHLRVMRDAQLVDVRVDGNKRLYRARAETLAEVRAYLETFWGDRLDTLRRRAESLHSKDGRRRERAR
jgi:DNA-binding transcriptional ArsR family regulator